MLDHRYFCQINHGSSINAIILYIKRENDRGKPSIFILCYKERMCLFKDFMALGDFRIHTSIKFILEIIIYVYIFI